MVFASLFLPLCYVAFLCICLTVSIMIPVILFVMAPVSLILLIVLLVLWRKLKKKGWFSREIQDQTLRDEGGYWKVIGMKAAKVSMIVLMVLCGISLVVCGIMLALIYL